MYPMEKGLRLSKREKNEYTSLLLLYTLLHAEYHRLQVGLAQHMQLTLHVLYQDNHPRMHKDSITII